jgi:hypothetical protein
MSDWRATSRSSCVVPGLTMNCDPGIDSRGIMGRVEDRAGADHGAFDFLGNEADSFQRRIGAQRDLDRLQSACDKSARQRHGGLGILDDQDRHDRLKLQGGEELFGFVAHGRTLF